MAKQTELTQKDTWKSLPRWARRRIRRESDLAEGIQADAATVAEDLASNPYQKRDVSKREINANKNVQESAREAGGRSDAAYDLLSGTAADVGSDIDADIAGLREYDEDHDYQAYRENWENPYLDDVVDTTLAGMDRENARKQNLRIAQENASGGTNNLRTAVADAIAAAEYNSTRAETESGLRSDAFNTASDYAFKEAEGQLDLDKAANETTMDVSDLRLDMADLTFDEAKALEEITQQSYERDSNAASWQATLGQAKRGIADDNALLEHQAAPEALDWYTGIYGSTKGSGGAASGGSSSSSTTRTDDGDWLSDGLDWASLAADTFG